MPFTPSHAVIALPFIRTPLVPAAIAIGAMTPHVPLFLRGVGLLYSFTHDLRAVPVTAVVALILFLLWRSVMRPAVGELTPRGVARRLPAEWAASGRAAAASALGVGSGQRLSLVWLAVSLVLGVVSHIGWDLFTHEGRWGVDAFPVLDAMWGPLSGYKWLQHGSSVVGLLVIGIWALLRLRRAEPRAVVVRSVPGIVRGAWWVSLPVMLVVATIIGYVSFGPFTAEFTLQHLAYRVLPSACAVWGVLTIALCLAMPLFRRNSAVTTREDPRPTAEAR